MIPLTGGRLIMRSLHEVHVEYALWSCHIRLSVRMIQLEKHWTFMDENRYRCWAIGDHPTIMLFNILRSVVTKRWMRPSVRWDRD
jgi:hypothetical protein